MKLLDFNLSTEKKIQQLQNHLVYLKRLSEISLVEPQDNKDQYLINCLDFVASLSLNSINGGFYQQKNQHIEMFLENNGLLAEFLLAAAHTFFNGELIYLANNTISAIIDDLYCPARKLFHTKKSYSISDAPFIFDEKQLSQLLESEELLLLNALTENVEADKNTTYWLSYKKTIKKAAAEVGLFLKKAQILEHGLRLKLIQYQSANPSEYQLSNEFCLSANARMLSLLIQSSIWHKQNQTIELIAELKESLLDIVNQDRELEPAQLVDLCYALLDYCQLKFDQKLVDLVTKKILSLKNRQDISQSDKIKFELVCDYLNQLQDKDIKINGLTNNPATNGNTSPYQKITVVKLFGSSLEQEKTRAELLASYNPFVKFFSVI